MSAPVALRRLLVALGLILGASPTAALADTPPSGWDRARDPGEADAWTLHVRVQGLIHAPLSGELSELARRREREIHCADALEKLEAADAEHSPDVRLRFDLGAVLSELGYLRGRLDLYDKAERILRAAVDAAPADPAVSQALENIAVADAKLDRPAEELAAWRRYIPLLLDPHARAVDQMNMGEAEMRLGQVDDALATFREVLRECAELQNASSTYVLTLWDLAVALDRSGDPRGAIEMATKAANQSVIDSRGVQTDGRGLIAYDPNVFFVPEWERWWYLAIGSGAKARESTDAHDTWAYWTRAEHEWGEYIAGASTSHGKDRWIAIAEVRRDRAHAERVAAERRLPRGSKRLPPRDEE